MAENIEESCSPYHISLKENMCQATPCGSPKDFKIRSHWVITKDNNSSKPVREWTWTMCFKEASGVKRKLFADDPKKVFGKSSKVKKESPTKRIKMDRCRTALNDHLSKLDSCDSSTLNGRPSSNDVHVISKRKDRG